MSPDQFFKTHSRITRSLKKFISDYEAQLDSDTFSAFLQNLSEEISKNADLINSHTIPEDRARTLHQLVEIETEQGNNIPVSCRMGCSACCHMEVEVTSYEAEILKNLVESGHPVDRARLQKQSQRSLQDPTWKQGPRNADSKCVFLGSEGACSIYEHRPVMCRRHSVTSPAKNCETLDAPITLRYFPRVDLLISAANEDTNMQIGPMAKMLEMALSR
ncbi:YkgJ family cysteine cluster protein [Bdellovibrio sp. HCB209]|uniref:YkgJ family cysteine cluster protein n=1 Tax=Bdellovibrio sp. HCB209 TaxID=3394354 RepID=UPI0039B5226A